LEAAIRHHLNPASALDAYDPKSAVLAPLGVDDLRAFSDPAEQAAIKAANVLAPQTLSDRQVQDIIAFLNALTDPASIEGALGIPAEVPSGLPVPVEP